MASSTFSGPVTSTAGFIGGVTGYTTVPTIDVVGQPDASTFAAGTIAYAADGAAGSPLLAFSDGTNWLRSDTGGAISLV
jgi:hypothetical protein